MKIHHIPNTRSVRIIWLCEELGLPYEVESYAFGDPRMREAGYLARHPMARVPVLEDGETVVFESGAIVQYVLARYGEGRLVPDAASPEFPHYLTWLHYAEGMMMPQVNTIVVETRMLPEDKRNPVNLERAVKLLTRMLTGVERQLEGRDYLAGAFSGADIMTGHASVVASKLGADLSDKPNTAAYVERLLARPAVQKAFAT
ncbi:glutathione S-transferase family protein [Marinibaculum pumilum]|uniref:Glutathione S-transferase family protein n=1 Tax=Marinibaculum pumilum TaxID=1766165 RepID=A0ABV7KVR9_9PROT